MGRLTAPCAAGPYAPLPEGGRMRWLLMLGTTLALAGRGLTAVPATITWDRWGMPHVDVPDEDAPAMAQLRALGFDEAGAEVFFPPVMVERANRGAVNFIVEPGAAAGVVVPPGTSGYIPPGGLGAVNLYDQLPLYEAFQYRSWRRTGEPLEDPTMTETLTPDERAGR